MTLSSEQKAIVWSNKTYVDVRAVPGCGKTHTAIACVKHWIQSGVPAKNILVLSFSNITVDHFKARLAMPDVCISTIHALGATLQGAAEVMDPSEAMEVLGNAIELLYESARNATGPSSAQRKRRAKTLRSLRPWLAKFHKSNCLARARSISLTRLLETSTDFIMLKPHAKLLETALRRYRTLKEKQGLLDFDDLVDESAVLQRVDAFRWTHLIVDEAQDCTKAQAQMIAGLCKRASVQAFRSFGDPMQCLYSFAGAGGADFADLLGCDAMSIRRSRRLTKPNAALAMCISRKAKEAIHTSRQGPAPKIIRSEWNEVGQEVYGQVRRHLRVSPGATVAILARTSAQIRSIDQALRAQGIWAKSVDSRVSNDVCIVLNACHWLAGKEKPVRNSAANLMPCLKILNADAENVTRTVKNYLVQAWECTTLEARLGGVIKAYVALTRGEEGKTLRNELRLWLPLARQYESAFLMWKELCATKEDGVELSTIHGAKGREWDHVIVLGVTDGLLPIYHALKKGKKLAEERRVMYVAVTRARETVQLIHTPARNPYSGMPMNKVSRYVRSAGDLIKSIPLATHQ